MSASGRVIAEFRRAGRPMRLLGASGQLGYGIPAASFKAGIERKPDLIGCDMGSIDIGPTYLGKGEMATSPASTRRDLRRVLNAARGLDVPLVIGTAGSAGAGPHLDATLAMLRDIARADGLRFRMAVMRADVPRPALLEAVRSGRVSSFDGMPALTEEDVTEAAHIVGQMGMGPFRKALEADVDVIVAGRACDTAIFASLPALLGFPVGLAMHMAKIIECGSLCCVPGGRDPILAELDHDGFVLESMNPERRATPTSVAAHSLYEQSDPFMMQEPDGTLDLTHARYEAVDDRRARVGGATWQDTTRPTIKLEGARKIGERAMLLCGSADPRFIEQCKALLPKVADLVQSLVCEEQPMDYTLRFRVYGIDGVRMVVPENEPPPGEVFIMGECIAPTAERAAEVVRTCKQFLLHFGYPGRLSTAGNVAFPFTPPEVSLGPAYRFNVYHLLHVDDADALFPVEIETV
ncbi:acyclic terpene utilization AtuA family protein [Acidisphaera sp. S103]|uniref:acyclic terpene utilization AtuA family protein n=1 Tax=Acidisphaera sp. S103 TaxID=1747223 RepID=UPI00131ADBD0|nr:acyclic terpene utilization AtuA family protein [Acidisphaera sp. S103]